MLHHLPVQCFCCLESVVEALHQVNHIATGLVHGYVLPKNVPVMARHVLDGVSLSHKSLQDNVAATPDERLRPAQPPFPPCQ